MNRTPDEEHNKCFQMMYELAKAWHETHAAKGSSLWSCNLVLCGEALLCIRRRGLEYESLQSTIGGLIDTSTGETLPGTGTLIVFADGVLEDTELES